MDEDKNMKIATFRFGIISEFVTGVQLDYGEKEKLIKKKTERSYNIPNSHKSSISRSTIMEWINSYKKAGYRIEGLKPKTRIDKGKYRKLDTTIRLAIKELKRENPNLTVPTLIKKLKHKKIIAFDEILNESCIYRFLKNEKLTRVNLDAADRRRFEAEFPNQIWQSDIMHGPKAIINGIHKKVYLCAIIDDFSRFIVHAEFYEKETLDTLKRCLEKAISARGLPQKLYVDNGSCYKALNLEQLTSCLGIALKHARPYKPQGKGKIERWFRNVRNNFLPFYEKETPLLQLNEIFNNWIDEYNNKMHSSTGQAPYDRYQKNLECVRPAPKDLLEYFRLIEFRRVKKDRTFQLNRKIFEAPVVLIDKKVELRFHKEDPEVVEIFFNNLSFGYATILDSKVNAKIGRDWYQKFDESNGRKKIDCLVDANTPQSGKLFDKGSNNEQL